MTTDNLQVIENQRLKLLAGRKVRRLVTLCVGVVGFVLINVFDLGPVIAAIGVIIIILTWIGYHSRFSKFRKLFKTQIIGTIINQLHSHMSYYPEQKIPRVIFDQARIFPSDYTDFKGEDLLISSDFGNLQLSELEVRRVVQDKDKKAQTTNYFTGIFGVATFPFKFAGTTVVYPRGFQYKNFDGHQVNLESPLFMRIFEIESTDQIEARLALGTDIMNNILYLHDELKARVWISFVDNQVFFAIEDTKFLEPDLNKSVVDNASVSSLHQELEIINNLIQTFKLRQS